jgi:hypothetical protein
MQVRGLERPLGAFDGPRPVLLRYATTQPASLTKARRVAPWCPPREETGQESSETGQHPPTLTVRVTVPPPSGGTVTHPESAATRSRRPSADAAAAPARVREEPTGPATAAAAARGLALLAEIRKLDRDAEFNPAISGFRISDAWRKRYGGYSGIPLDKAEKWLAWAAEQVADEQAQMQAASRHRLADPERLGDVLATVLPDQQGGAAS